MFNDRIVSSVLNSKRKDTIKIMTNIPKCLNVHLHPLMQRLCNWNSLRPQLLGKVGICLLIEHPYCDSCRGSWVTNPRCSPLDEL